MTPDELLSQLRSIDDELHSSRVVAFYRREPAESRERFVGLRAYVARALADATHARLDVLAAALETHDEPLRAALTEVTAALTALNDALRILEVLGTVLIALSESVPGVLDQVLP